MRWIANSWSSPKISISKAIFRSNTSYLIVLKSTPSNFAWLATYTVLLGRLIAILVVFALKKWIIIVLGSELALEKRTISNSIFFFSHSLLSWSLSLRCASWSWITTRSKKSRLTLRQHSKIIHFLSYLLFSVCLHSCLWRLCSSFTHIWSWKIWQRRSILVKNGTLYQEIHMERKVALKIYSKFTSMFLGEKSSINTTNTFRLSIMKHPQVNKEN